MKSLVEKDPNKRISNEDLITNSILSSFDELMYNDGPQKVSEIMKIEYISETKYLNLSN